MRISLNNSRVERAEKIAVLRANSLGDFIFCLPALEALRAAYPSAEIVLLGRPWHREFLAGRPGPVDRVIVVPYSNGVHEPPPGRRENARELDDFFDGVRQENFDIALQMHGGGRHSNPFISRLGARVTAGLASRDAAALDRTIPYLLYHPEVLRYLEVAALVGARPVVLEPCLQATQQDIGEALAYRAEAERPLAVIHPGTTDPRRRWPAGRFSAVGDLLAGRGFDVIVTGDGTERELAAEVCDRMQRPARNSADRLSLRALTGLLYLAQIVISNDSGPLHLARAVGAPTVGIYWVGNTITAGPLTLARHRRHLSWRLDCPVCGANCIQVSCPHDCSFVADIPVEDVCDSIEDLMSRLRAEASAQCGKN